MIDFVQNGNGWLVLGLLLIIIEMLGNFLYVSISFGLGSIATGLLIKARLIPSISERNLIDETLVMAITSVAALIAIRIIFKKRETGDINKY